MEKALLTGAYGFLGRHLLQCLAANYQVDTLGLNPANTYVTDLSKDVPALKSNYDIIVHAAAYSLVSENVSDEIYFETNSEGTRRLCLAFNERNEFPGHFIFISSVAVYGLKEGILISEEYSLKGETAYAKSKIAAEAIVTNWCALHKVNCTILRLPLLVGAHASGNFGKMVDAISKRRFFIPGHGQVRKSMLLAEDVAAFIAGKQLKQGVYNLTDCHHPSLNIIADIIARQCGVKPPLHVPYWICKILATAGDIIGKKFPFNSRILEQLTTSLTFNDSKAIREMGWAPQQVINHLELNQGK